MQRYRELEVWKRSHALVLRVYHLTKAFPDDERFGLTSQLRRAAVSVPSNIAEGSKRRTDQDFARFLNIAEGSLSETDYLLLCAKDLGYVASRAQVQLADEIDEISRMLYTFRRRIEPAK
jgi:four helix bundle protein